MGTQQLLLIVLGVIIVGIAVVLGIGFAGSSMQQANADAVLEDCLRLANGAQIWYGKPTMLGGGGNSFIGSTITKAGWQQTTNENGSFTISDVSTGAARITGIGNQNVIVTLRVYSDSVSSPRVIKLDDAIIESN